MKGSEVKKIFKSIGISQAFVAEKLNVSPQVLASILRTSDIKVGVLQRIAKAIDKDIFFFLGNPDVIYIPKVSDEIKKGRDYRVMMETIYGFIDYLNIFKK